MVDARGRYAGPRWMQSAPPPPPYAPPPNVRPRAGWGRFWLGVLTGGCAVLVLEAIAALILLLVIGSAINGAVQRATGGGGTGALPGLPGGVPLPATLPGLTQRSDPCSPQPCVAHDGMTVLVGKVDRNAGPAADGSSHLVEMEVTFVATSGTHTVTPEEVAI